MPEQLVAIAPLPEQRRRRHSQSRYLGIDALLVEISGTEANWPHRMVAVQLAGHRITVVYDPAWRIFCRVASPSPTPCGSRGQPEVRQHHGGLVAALPSEPARTVLDDQQC